MQADTESELSLNVLIVTEGSGGHLIPALEVARELASLGAKVKLWYAKRQQTAPLTNDLASVTSSPAVDVEAISLKAGDEAISRLWMCGKLWRKSLWYFDEFHPDVVVGFGGWISAPVILAARKRRIGCLLHEQNVLLGRANRFLQRWVDRVAISFEETQTLLNGTQSIMTGLPIRSSIGSRTRKQAAERFGFDPQRPTLLVLGGSQGARTLNHIMIRALERLSSDERATWQVIHLAGMQDENMVRAAYESKGICSYVSAFLTEMDAAYAIADVAIVRAGASTLAELAQCGVPGILIPYPYAGAHQRANARVVEALGAGVLLEETDADPERIMGIVRNLLSDRKLRAMMASQMRRLAVPDAAARVARTIAELKERVT